MEMKKRFPDSHLKLERSTKADDGADCVSLLENEMLQQHGSASRFNPDVRELADRVAEERGDEIYRSIDPWDVAAVSCDWDSHSTDILKARYNHVHGRTVPRAFVPRQFG